MATAWRFTRMLLGNMPDITEPFPASAMGDGYSLLERAALNEAYFERHMCALYGAFAPPEYGNPLRVPVGLFRMRQRQDPNGLIFWWQLDGRVEDPRTFHLFRTLDQFGLTPLVAPSMINAIGPDFPWLIRLDFTSPTALADVTVSGGFHAGAGSESAGHDDAIPAEDYALLTDDYVAAELGGFQHAMALPPLAPFANPVAIFPKMHSTLVCQIKRQDMADSAHALYSNHRLMREFWLGVSGSRYTYAPTDTYAGRVIITGLLDTMTHPDNIQSTTTITEAATQSAALNCWHSGSIVDDDTLGVTHTPGSAQSLNTGALTYTFRPPAAVAATVGTVTLFLIQEMYVQVLVDGPDIEEQFTRQYRARRAISLAMTPQEDGSWTAAGGGRMTSQAIGGAVQTYLQPLIPTRQSFGVDRIDISYACNVIEYVSAMRVDWDYLTLIEDPTP